MARKQKFQTLDHPSPSRRNIRASSKSDLGVGAGGGGRGGSSQAQDDSDDAPSQKSFLEKKLALNNKVFTFFACFFRQQMRCVEFFMVHLYQLT